MEKSKRKTVRGTVIPEYVIDILIDGICPVFLEMTILHENMTYVFSYNETYYEEVKEKELSLQDLIDLLEVLFGVNRECASHLIEAEDYMIGYEYMRKRKGMTLRDGFRLIYYPDLARKPFEEKMIALIDHAPAVMAGPEKEAFERIRNDLKGGDLFRAEMSLQKLKKRLQKAA